MLQVLDQRALGSRRGDPPPPPSTPQPTYPDGPGWPVLWCYPIPSGLPASPAPCPGPRRPRSPLVTGGQSTAGTRPSAGARGWTLLLLRWWEQLRTCVPFHSGPAWAPAAPCTCSLPDACLEGAWLAANSRAGAGGGADTEVHVGPRSHPDSGLPTFNSQGALGCDRGAGRLSRYPAVVLFNLEGKWPRLPGQSVGCGSIRIPAPTPIPGPAAWMPPQARPAQALA